MLTTAAQDFVDIMGRIFQADGFSSHAGQILAYLSMTGEACDLLRLSAELGMTRGMVLTNIRTLEARGMIERSDQEDSRQAFWRAKKRHHGDMLPDMAQRFRIHAIEMERIVPKFRPDESSARAAVSDAADFYRKSASFLDEWSSRLRSDVRK